MGIDQIDQLLDNTLSFTKYQNMQKQIELASNADIKTLAIFLNAFAVNYKSKAYAIKIIIMHLQNKKQMSKKYIL